MNTVREIVRKDYFQYYYYYYSEVFSRVPATCSCLDGALRSLISDRWRAVMEAHLSEAVEYLLDDAVIVHRGVLLLSCMNKQLGRVHKEHKDKAN